MIKTLVTITILTFTLPTQAQVNSNDRNMEMSSDERDPRGAAGRSIDCDLENCRPHAADGLPAFSLNPNKAREISLTLLGHEGEGEKVNGTAEGTD